MSWAQLSGFNAGWVLELYEQYLRDPDSVGAATRTAFDTWPPPPDEAPAPTWSPPGAARVAGSPGGVTTQAVVGAANLVECIRRYGHLAAQIDPLGSVPLGDPSLSLAAHGVSVADLEALPASLVGGPVAERASNALEAVEALRRIYCSTSGFDIAHVFVPEERQWLREAIEAGRYLPPQDALSSLALLNRLTQIEVFERFLQRTFPGKTRFSIEGLDMLVPILDEIICGAADDGTRHTLMGMAHRGRLNVLAHVLQKPYAQILAEFKDPIAAQNLRVDEGWMGDVKYHAGARATAPRGQMKVSLAPNPSHLEAVNPVVVGMARAAGTQTDAGGPARFDGASTLPILIHGDAAFSGQGVVAETLNLLRLCGYDTGGTIHIIANNQIGFTATPVESFSTSYASGLARGFKIPIVHVNADDPVACLEATRLAWAYRACFRRDFIIDLVGYRRYGHNEGDEPSFTQPVTYAKVAAQPTVREILASTLQRLGTVTAEHAESLVAGRMSVLEQTLASLQPEADFVAPVSEPAPAGAAEQVKTGVAVERLASINASLLASPPGFNFHAKLTRGRARRATAFADRQARTIDWAAAEQLALASVVADGVPVRLTGEDVERGTFSHRHAVYHDATTGERFVPLQSFAHARASFEVHNTPLTENATIGFEVGYNLQEPGRLVIWEAQYGDFINGAQVILDQFVTSGRSKWGLLPSLVLLLPHGYEGQGPEHSSARPERFLQAAADVNLRLVNCTTAAQYFHVLRRQAALLKDDPLPLIVLTPKSLLRHPSVSSTPAELEEGRFLSVINDPSAVLRAASVRRVVLCSGKIAVDLDTSERRKASPEVAICRMEQLYPFPGVALRDVLGSYPNASEVVWAQEEPENMGAWEFVQPLIDVLLDGRCPLGYIGRPRSSSPSEGSSTWHQLNQKAIVDQVFDGGPVPPHASVRSTAAGAWAGVKR